MSGAIIGPNHRRRLRRANVPGTARALTFSCFQRRAFLTSERACSWLAEAIDRARDRHCFDLWAFAFLPEHVHVLLLPHRARPDVGPILSTIKGSVAKRAVRWVRTHEPASLARMADIAPDGAVTHRFWQRGAGFDHNLWSPTSIWRTIDYIHLNPVRRGLCARPPEWRWSSAATFHERADGPLRLDLHSLPPQPANY